MVSFLALNVVLLIFFCLSQQIHAFGNQTSKTGHALSKIAVSYCISTRSSLGLLYHWQVYSNSTLFNDFFFVFLSPFLNTTENFPGHYRAHTHTARYRVARCYNFFYKKDNSLAVECVTCWLKWRMFWGRYALATFALPVRRANCKVVVDKFWPAILVLVCCVCGVSGTARISWRTFVGRRRRRWWGCCCWY